MARDLGEVEGVVEVEVVPDTPLVTDGRSGYVLSDCCDTNYWRFQLNSTEQRTTGAGV